MKTILKTWIISTVTLAAITGCSSNHDDKIIRPVSLFQQSDPGTPSATLENKTYETTHFSIAYPGDWTVQEAFSDNIKNIVFSSPDFSTTINLFETEQKETPISSTQLFDGAKEELLPLLPEGSALKETKITIDQTTADALSFDTLSDEGKIFYERYLCIKGTTAFDISIQTTEKEKPIVGDILTSMKLK